MRERWEKLRAKAERDMDPLELSLLASLRDDMAAVDSLIRQGLRIEYDKGEREAEDEWAEALDDR